MTSYRIKSMVFKKLKGLNNVKIEFGDYLTAIMGVNGIGKSTVIHALACVFQPENERETQDYRFPQFFVPNTDALWSGSEFRVIIHDLSLPESDKKYIVDKRFGKSSDRWTPPYNSRPKRNVYYLGIVSCVPEIERVKTTTRIYYKTQKLEDDNSKKIIEYASYILNKDYQSLLSNTIYSRKIRGIKTTTGLKYSALSMGTGEQRVLTIIETVVNAAKYSLILIDEIDLLLHVSAVRKMITVLHKIAEKKKLQIVFTTHSLEMLSLTEYAKIQYLIQNNGSNEMFVLDKVTDSLIYDLTEVSKERYKFYVEDDLAEAVLTPILKSHNIRSVSKIVRFGAAINAFTLAASNVLAQEETNGTKICIILDGDAYSTSKEKKERICKLLTGNEKDSDERRTKAVSLITQFNLPPGYAPEPFLHSLILDYFDHNSEFYKEAYRLRNNIDSHSFIKDLCQKLQCDNKEVVQEIVNQSQLNDDLREKWAEYTRLIDEWIKSHYEE